MDGEQGVDNGRGAETLISMSFSLTTIHNNDVWTQFSFLDITIDSETRPQAPIIHLLYLINVVNQEFFCSLHRLLFGIIIPIFVDSEFPLVMLYAIIHLKFRAEKRYGIDETPEVSAKIQYNCSFRLNHALYNGILPNASASSYTRTTPCIAGSHCLAQSSAHTWGLKLPNFSLTCSVVGAFLNSRKDCLRSLRMTLAVEELPFTFSLSCLSHARYKCQMQNKIWACGQTYSTAPLVIRSSLSRLRWVKMPMNL
ncbi:hypothetical protein V1525DRAFT_59475 [Lipomyces kononenkoae]|uniref:Uncharacterized protein n=1 Tax=Lipomyces kononenkoae TaxID=34357 RepID=A0ACC3STJ0_LIPKO